MVTSATCAQHVRPAVVESGRLRVAHVSATFPPYVDGTAAVAYHDALELARLGHDVHVLTAGPSRATEQPLPNLTVRRFEPRLRLGNAPFAPELSRGLAGFDLVHLHYPFYFGAEQVWWAHKHSGIPYVVTYHQDVILQGALCVLDRLHHQLSGRQILSDARFVAATSADYAMSSRLTSVAPARLVELPNGVDTERFHPMLPDQDLQRRYALSASDAVLLFVATLDRAHYFKGLRVLLSALQLLPEAKLLVVGDGQLRPVYEHDARAAGLASRTRFLGHIPAADLPAHFALATVVTVPSTTRGEAFSLVALEAMASGKPVIASSLPGVRSVIDDGATGLLAEPGNAADLATKLRLLAEDRDLARRMGLAGRQKAQQRYDWGLIGELLERLYRQAIDRCPEHDS